MGNSSAADENDEHRRPDEVLNCRELLATPCQDDEQDSRQGSDEQEDTCHFLVHTHSLSQVSWDLAWLEDMKQQPSWPSQ